MNQEVVNTSVSKPGLLEKIKHALSPDTIAQRFNITRSSLLEMGLYLIVGFLVGYVLKKYSKFVFICAIVFLFLIILNQLDIISIAANWNRIQDLLGITTTDNPTAYSLLMSLWNWIKTHVGLTLSFTVGFLIGLRLG